jgi:hypothetical protein
METDNLKVGDFVHGSYKCGCVCGVVFKIKKNVAVIQRYRRHYDIYTETDIKVNLTLKRISQVGK